MRRPGLRFWVWAFGVAGAVAGAAALLMPYGTLGLATAAERERAWLLTVWTAGVMAVLFGLTARIGMRGVGVRDVADAGSVRAAIEERRRAQRADAGPALDLWLIATGGILIGIYFAGWLVLG
ncbi:MAG TPA: hypothetical protein VHG51_01230 [Longimicrobiaceae bacterium]|nr:hypothetical protein [Longimicrobiaceae bacterium]